MLQLGVAGAGHLGKIHLRCASELDEVNVVGFYDSDAQTRKAVSEELGIPAFETYQDLLAKVQAVDIVTPTPTHHALAMEALQAGKDVFLEKPVTETPEQAKELAELANRENLKIQVGHVERFNPAFLALDQIALNPMFIEGHRLAIFNPRGTDVSVVLDLMIHDLDLLLACVPSEVTDVDASGVTVISDTPDIANARIRFANGCVANLTASRISLKQMRKFRLFQNDAYISMDFLEKKTEVIRMLDQDQVTDFPGQVMDLKTDKGTKKIGIHLPEIPAVNAIKKELEKFADCIAKDVEPTVSINDGYRALKLAFDIMNQIKN